MRFKAVIKVASMVVMFFLRLITGAGYQSQLERSMASLTTQVSLGLLEMADEFRRRSIETAQ